MRIICTLLLALSLFLPNDALAKRITLPSMFFDIPANWVMIPLKARQVPKGAEGMILKPSAKSNYSVTFAILPPQHVQKTYHTPLKKVNKKHIINGSMTFAGHTAPSVFWSETSNAAQYLLEIPSKKNKDLYIMHIKMTKGTQKQWDTWSTEAEKILRSLHRKR